MVSIENKANDGLFWCEKEIGDFVKNVIQRYIKERTDSPTEDCLDSIILEERHAAQVAILTKHLIKPTETLGRERTEAEKQQDYSKATEDLLYIRGVDRLLKRLLREEIDISEFIEHAESKQIATREFNRYFQGEIDFYDYIDWLRENSELVESASEFDDDE